MIRRTSVILLGLALLVAGTHVSSAVASPPYKTQSSYKSMILMPEPINPTPISVRQVCQVVQTVMGITGFWQSLGKNVSIWITIPVYGSSIVCTNVFF